MLSLRKALSFLAGILLAVQAHAQTNQCNALLDHGIANLRTQTNEETYLSVIKDHYCSSNYDSMSNQKQASFSAVIKTIPVGLSGSGSSAREKHASFCKTYESTLNTSAANYLSTVSIHDRALQAWSDCQQLAARQMEVEMTPFANDEGVDFRLLWRTTGTSRLLGVDTLNMTCKMGDAKLDGSENVVLSPTSARSIRCTRDYEDLALSGYTARYYRDANVKVKTQEGDYRMEFADMVRGPAKTRFDQLEAEVARSHALLRAYQAALTTRTGDMRGTITGDRESGQWGSWKACPAGSYVTAVQVEDADTGSKCTQCISNVRLRCSVLPELPPLQAVASAGG